jgi:hypothetical protein
MWSVQGKSAGRVRPGAGIRCFQVAAERLGVTLDAYGAGHLHERLQFAAAEVPDEPEIEEGDPAATLEQGSRCPPPLRRGA